MSEPQKDEGLVGLAVFLIIFALVAGFILGGIHVPTKTVLERCVRDEKARICELWKEDRLPFQPEFEDGGYLRVRP